MEELLKVGIITTTHGIRGQVKVFPTTDDPQRFDDLRQVILKTPKTQQTLTVVSVQYFKRLVILKFKEYDNINDVEPYKGAELYVTRGDAVPLEENEYYVADLIGLSVETEEGKTLGRICDVIETGANDVYVVRCADDREVLIPAIRQCVKDVNIGQGRLIIHVMDGLLD